MGHIKYIVWALLCLSISRAALAETHSSEKESKERDTVSTSEINTTPEVPDIEKQIEDLLEKEHLELEDLPEEKEELEAIREKLDQMRKEATENAKTLEDIEKLAKLTDLLAKVEEKLHPVEALSDYDFASTPAESDIEKKKTLTDKKRSTEPVQKNTDEKEQSPDDFPNSVAKNKSNPLPVFSQKEQKPRDPTAKASSLVSASSNKQVVFSAVTVKNVPQGLKVFSPEIKLDTDEPQIITNQRSISQSKTKETAFSVKKTKPLPPPSTFPNSSPTPKSAKTISSKAPKASLPSISDFNKLPPLAKSNIAPPPSSPISANESPSLAQSKAEIDYSPVLISSDPIQEETKTNPSPVSAGFVDEQSEITFTQSFFDTSPNPVSSFIPPAYNDPTQKPTKKEIALGDFETVEISVALDEPANASPDLLDLARSLVASKPLQSDGLRQERYPIKRTLPRSIGSLSEFSRWAANQADNSI